MKDNPIASTEKPEAQLKVTSPADAFFKTDEDEFKAAEKIEIHKRVLEFRRTARMRFEGGL